MRWQRVPRPTFVRPVPRSYDYSSWSSAAGGSSCKSPEVKNEYLCRLHPALTSPLPNSGAGILVTFLISAAFLVCGRSLRSAIKTSMQQHQQQQQQMRTPAEGARDPLEAQEDGRTTVPTRLGRGARRSSLAAAKKKVERVMTFIMAMAIPSCIVGVITITTHYGIEAPLIVMAAITYASLLWLMVNIQLHAGRSRTHGRMFSPKSNGGPISPNDGFSGINDTLFHQHKIAPTEAPRWTGYPLVSK